MSLIINGRDYQQRVIASIWPLPLRADRPLYNGLFTLPGVEKGADPVLLYVRHHEEHREEPVTHIKRSETITSAEIANCICNEWSGNGLFMDEFSGPGVWILKLPDGRIPDVDRPEEIRLAIAYGEPIARARQAEYANRKIAKADEIYRETESSKGIDAVTKLLCKYYGRDRKWLDELKDGDITICPICSKTNPRKALKCQYCHATIDPIGLARQERQMAEAWKAANKLVNAEERAKQEAEKLAAQQARQDLVPEPEPEQESIVTA